MQLPFDPTSRWVRLAALVLGVLVLVGGLVQIRAQREAREAATQAEARYAFQQELTLAYDAVAEPTRAATDALSSLRELLQQHLAITGRTGEDLAADRDRLLAELVAAADELRAAAAAPAPEAPAALAPDAPRSLTEQLDTLRIEAEALASSIDAVVDATDRWASALAELRQGALAFVAIAESHPATTDPEELAEQWRSEREPLVAYRDAVDAAAALPGLAPVADAHRAYVDANLAWIDEAVGLLDAGQLDAYNARLAEVFAGEDPFGFRTALEAAITQAFDLGLLGDLARVREDATALLDRIAEARRLTPILLRPSDRDARPADELPTPSPAGDD